MTDEVREMCERLRKRHTPIRPLDSDAASLLERLARELAEAKEDNDEKAAVMQRQEESLLALRRELAEAREDAERLRGELDDVYAARASERSGETPERDDFAGLVPPDTEELP